MLAVVIATMVPAASHAQLGSLKKKMKDKIAGDAQPASTPATTATAGDADAKARQDAWQLAVRDAGGELRKWTAWRFVPLGLLVLPR